MLDNAWRSVAIVAVASLAALGVRPASAQPPTLAPLRPGLGGTATVPAEKIASECPPFTDIKPGVDPNDLRDCRVSRSGELGMVGGRTYSYAIYCLIPNDAIDKSRCGDETETSRYFRERGLAIFTRDRSSSVATLLVERAGPDLGIFVFPREPAIVDHPAGTLLFVPITVDGTGSGNASEYYVWNGDEWQPIESERWLDDLRRRLPPGLQIRKGIWPDLETMRAETGLYREGDANCCPTGGTARVTLAIRSRQFVLESVVVGQP